MSLHEITLAGREIAGWQPVARWGTFRLQKIEGKEGKVALV